MYCPNPECPNLRRHGIPAEFRDDIFECSECGHRLEHGEPPVEQIEPIPEEVSWMQIAAFDDTYAAHAAKGLLEAQGIPAMFSDRHFAALSQLPTAVVGELELSVPEADAARASELLHDFATRDAELPLDDEYEDFETYQESEEGADLRRFWRLVAVLLFIAAAYVTFSD